MIYLESNLLNEMVLNDGINMVVVFFEFNEGVRSDWG